MTVNTDWKLTDLSDTALFIFDSSNGWHPTNENQTVELTGESYNIPWDNLVQKLDYGLGGRSISLIGEDVADEDVWKLSSTICKRQLMKLWVGEDWFYYVLGREPRQVRDESLPYTKTYTVGLIAVDPHYYYSNEGTPTAAIDNTGITVDLTGSGSNQGTTYVEPCFWVIGSGGSAAVTKVTIQDQWGRKLEYEPTSTIADSDEHVIMPYRNTLQEGFSVNDATGFKVTSDGKTGTTAPSGSAGSETGGDWALDVFQHGAGSDDSTTAANNVYKWITEEVPLILSRNGTDFVEKNREYPRCLDGVSNTLTVSYTGTADATSTYAQWCVRRV